MFPRIEYLEWMEGRPDAALHDLAASDLRGDRDTGTASPDILEPYQDPPAGISLETQLATLYGVDPEHVMVTAGASHANFIVAATMIDAATDAGIEEPRTLVELPGYEPLVKTPDALGATVDRFRRTPDTGYALDPDRIDNAFDDDTIAVTLTNRHNPSGYPTDRDTLADIAAIARANDSRVHVDEVYAPYTRDDDGPGPFGGPTAAGLDDVVITNSLTKYFGLGDVRIGWIVADPSFIQRARTVLAHTPHAADTSRALARRALHAHDSLTNRANDLLTENTDLLETYLADHPTLSGTVYGDAPYATVTHATVDGDTLAATAADAGVLIVPGRFFGDADTVRLSLGRAPTACAASLDALDAAIADLGPTP